MNAEDRTSQTHIVGHTMRRVEGGNTLDGFHRAATTLLIVFLFFASPTSAIAVTRLGISRCGPMAMEICASMCGMPVAADDIDDLVEGDPEGCTLAEIQRVGGLLGLRTLAIRWPHGLPAEVAGPAVIPTVNADGRRHFVTLAGCRSGNALIVNLPSRPEWVSENYLRTSLMWKGEALHFAKDDESVAKLGQYMEMEVRRRRDAALFTTGAVLAATSVVIAAATYVRIARHRRSEHVATVRGDI
jgi:ABC-type bacteriocin/lantibiotic exporter with double-glycine peptidase domain